MTQNEDDRTITFDYKSLRFQNCIAYTFSDFIDNTKVIF